MDFKYLRNYEPVVSRKTTDGNSNQNPRNVFSLATDQTARSDTDSGTPSTNKSSEVWTSCLLRDKLKSAGSAVQEENRIDGDRSARSDRCVNRVRKLVRNKGRIGAETGRPSDTYSARNIFLGISVEAR